MAGSVNDIKVFSDKFKSVTMTFPNAGQIAADRAGDAVKKAWLGIAAANGVPPGKPIARARWSVNYSVKGGAKATTIVAYNGPLHLVIGKTKAHIIGARRLGTRSKIKRKSGVLAANRAQSVFGPAVSGRGTFGTLRSATVKGRDGSTREFNGKQAISFPAMSTPRAYVFHRGTQGKPRMWEESKAAAERIGTATYQAEYRKALAKSGFGAGKTILGAIK